MAGPYDFESLYGLDPETSAMLRSKYAPEQGDMGRPVQLPPGIDPSWLQQPAAAPSPAPAPAAPVSNAHSPAPPIGSKPSLFDYAGTLKPEPQAAAPAAEQEAPAVRLPGPSVGGGGGAVMVSPGGMRTDSIEVSAKRTGNPEDVNRIGGQLDSAQGYGISGAEKAYQAGALNNAIDVREALARQDVARSAEAELQRIAIERKQFVEERRARLQAMSDDLAKDPSKEYWASKTGGEKALGFLGVMLSSIGASIAGGPNLAVQKIENEINRGIATKEKAYGRAKNEFQDMLAEFGDRSLAVQAYKVAAYDKVAQQMMPMRAAAKSRDAEARLDTALGLVMEKRAKGDQELQKLLGVQYDEKTTQKYKDPVYAGGGASAKPLENTVSLADGTTYQFQNSEQGNEAMKKATAHATIQSLNAQALEMRQRLKSLDPGSAEYEATLGRLQKVAIDVAAADAVARGQGSMTDSERDAKLAASPILKGLPSSGAFMGTVSKVNPWKQRDFEAGNQGIQSEIKQSETELRAVVRAGGTAIVQKGYTTDPKTGRLVRTGEYTGQDVAPEQYLAPRGFKPLDDRKRTETAARPLSETTKAAHRADLRKK